MVFAGYNSAFAEKLKLGGFIQPIFFGSSEIEGFESRLEPSGA
jgi:hypothetical protein